VNLLARRYRNLGLTTLVLVIWAAGCSAPSPVASPSPSVTSGPSMSGGSSPSPSLAPVPPGIGAWIVYQWGSPCAVEPGDRDVLCLVRPDGLERHEIDLGMIAKHPDWSPDGTHLTFTGTSSTDEVWMVALDGSGLRKIAGCDDDASPECQGLDYPAWSPDGLSIAFTRYDGPPRNGRPSRSAIEIVDLATGARREVASLRVGELLDQVRWSADGQSLVAQIDRFNQGGEETGAAIAILPAAGGSPNRIVDWAEFAGYPDWNPVDGRIVYVGNELNPDGGPIALFTANADGTGVTQLTAASIAAHPTSPAWSHDGAWVLFVDFDRRQPMLIAADGSAVINLGFPATHPRLSPGS
jgi:Tol biopolymer transport system component